MIYNDTFGTPINVRPIAARYEYHNNLCILLQMTDTHEIYGAITTNIDPLPRNEAAVDTNNHPNVEKFITDNNLGVPTGKTIRSGFCTYPVYAFNLDKIPDE